MLLDLRSLLEEQAVVPVESEEGGYVSRTSRRRKVVEEQRPIIIGTVTHRLPAVRCSARGRVSELVLLGRGTATVTTASSAEGEVLPQVHLTAQGTSQVDCVAVGYIDNSLPRQIADEDALLEELLALGLVA